MRFSLMSISNGLVHHILCFTAFQIHTIAFFTIGGKAFLLQMDEIYRGLSRLRGLLLSHKRHHLHNAKHIAQYRTTGNERKTNPHCA